MGYALKALVIGCGNLLRGDDAAGPVLGRRLGVGGRPAGVRCPDGGTAGMDVAFQMRGVPRVILVDACSSGSKPGTIFEVAGHEVENLPPLTGINLHAFRWDHAIAFGHWLLKDEYPETVTAYLIEGERYEIGQGLSPAVDKAVDRLADLLLAKLGPQPAEAFDATPLPRPPPVGVRRISPTTFGDMMHEVSPTPEPTPDDTSGWCSGPQADEVTAEKPIAFEGAGAKILVLRWKDELRAFRNACGHVGLPLERGMCDVEAGTITCPWHGFRFDADTGECLSAPQCRLEPFPLRVTAGVVWVKPS